MNTTTRYSPSACVFYPFDVHYKTVPEDVIVVPIEDYQAAMNRPAGHTISVTEGRVVTVPPTPPSAAEVFTRARRNKLAEINADFEASISATKNGYPPSEMLTWDKQEKEARAYLADPNASTPFIDALCAERGIVKDELVSRVIIKVEAAETAVGTATGKRQRLEDQVHAIADDDPDALTKLATIVWA